MRFVVLTQIFWYIWVFWWGLSFLMWSEVSFDFASVLWSHIMFLFVCQGDQARNFFLQSGLPPPILAQIWWVTSTGSYNQLWNIRLKITQWWSFTLWSIQIYLKLFFFFFFFSLLKGSGWYEQWWPYGHSRVLHRHETHQTETPGSPSAPVASSQYETTPTAFTTPGWLW